MRDSDLDSLSQSKLDLYKKGSRLILCHPLLHFCYDFFHFAVVRKRVYLSTHIGKHWTSREYLREVLIGWDICDEETSIYPREWDEHLDSTFLLEFIHVVALSDECVHDFRGCWEQCVTNN